MVDIGIRMEGSIGKLAHEVAVVAGTQEAAQLRPHWKAIRSGVAAAIDLEAR